MSDVFSKEQSPDAPNEAHLKAILNHTSKLTSADRLLVNCWAGQSRSTAACLAILIQHGIDYKTAFEMILEERDVALPNGLLVEFIDDHFNLGGELVKLITEHRRSELAATYIQHSQVQPPGQDEVDEVKRLMKILGG